MKPRYWQGLLGALCLAIASSLPALTPEQQLGLALYHDEDLSANRNQACATCHSLEPAESPGGEPMAAPGFVDPDNLREGSAVSRGSHRERTGALNTPATAYAAFSPAFHWDAVEGLFVGGQFWNGRAATLAAQAGQPILNPDEMALPSKWAAVTRLKEKPLYVEQFEALYGLDLDAIPAKEAAAADLAPPPGVTEAFDALARALAEFEKSRLFNRFTSKFDYVLAGRTALTPLEQQGRELFDGKGKCNECHISEPGIAPDGGVLPPLFTDFTYDNLGLPRNMKIPGNPAPDPGLAGNPVVAALGDEVAARELGKHKVVTLRNIALTPPYGHNGVFATLEQITRFYNRRDWALEGINGMSTCADNTDPGFAETCFPPPELTENLNTEELGDLGLSDEEEAAIVAFMRTLTDGYPEWGEDPRVPPGTPSPFADTPLPPAP